MNWTFINIERRGFSVGNVIVSELITETYDLGIIFHHTSRIARYHLTNMIFINKSITKFKFILLRMCYSLILLYHGKEKIHSEIELIIYQLKWYSPTCIIGFVLLVLCPKLVYYWPRSFRALYLFLSASLSACSCLRDTASFILPPYRKSRGTSHYTTNSNIKLPLFTNLKFVSKTKTHPDLFLSHWQKLHETLPKL